MAALPRTSKGLKPVVRPKVDDVLTYFDTNTITHGWGPNTVPDHNNLRCYDFMVPNIAAGNRVASYLIQNLDRLGINGIIWNRKVFRNGGTYTGGPKGQWGIYGQPNPHTDHLHVEFNSTPIKNVTVGGDTPAPPIEKDEDMANIESISDEAAQKIGKYVASSLIAQSAGGGLVVHAALQSVSDKAKEKLDRQPKARTDNQ